MRLFRAPNPRHAGGPQRSPRRRQSGDPLALAAVLGAALALALAVRLAPPLAMLESRARDLIHAAAYPRGALSADVVLVMIGEGTLAKLPYRSPVDRAFLAGLIEDLAAHRPAAIGVDLLLDQPTEPDKDAALRATLARHATLPVVLAMGDETDGLRPAQAVWLAAFLRGLPRGLAVVLRETDTGVARGAPGPRVVAGVPTPALAVALAAAAGAAVPDGPVALAYSPPLPLDGRRFPAFPAEVVAALPETWIAGRVVLIGLDLEGIDRHDTPVSALAGGEAGVRPGVELHAQLVQQLIDGRRLVEPGPWAELAAAALAAALGAAAMAAPLAVWARTALAATALATAVAAPAAALALAGVRAPVAAPLLACAAGALIVGARRWRAETEARRRIRATFSRYVSPSVVAQALADPDAARLEGQRREISCVFTDVAGFTGLCETLPPERLCALLNRYLDGMARLFLDHGATLDKFVGDAVIGFFGAPVPRPDHAAAAVRLALALDAFGQRFCAEAAAEGVVFGVTRVGVNTGIATVGDFGGERFFDYTALGDTVNVAARLEGANKAFGTRVCVSQATAAASGALAGLLEGIVVRPVAEIGVKGRAARLAAFQPLALSPGQDGAAMTAPYRAAFALLEGDPAAAKVAFDALGAANPDDPLVALHRSRLARGETGRTLDVGG